MIIVLWSFPLYLNNITLVTESALYIKYCKYMETEDQTRIKASEIYTICQHGIKSTKLKFKKCVTYINEHNGISNHLTTTLTLT